MGNMKEGYPLSCVPRMLNIVHGPRYTLAITIMAGYKAQLQGKLYRVLAGLRTAGPSWPEMLW